jgi:hypothetical protein
VCDVMHDENVTSTVTTCDASEGNADTEGNVEAEADGEYPGWLPFLSVSQAH